MLPPAGANAQFTTAKEHQLKAAFVFNFVKFVEWSGSRFQDANSPLIIAVAGQSPITAELVKAATGRKINGRELIIKNIETPEAARSAHVLFVSRGEDHRLDGWLAAVQGQSILSIGESDQFGAHGGMINFVLEGEQLRFDINVGSAEAVKLRISSELQKLAKTVRRKP